MQLGCKDIRQKLPSQDNREKATSVVARTERHEEPSEDEASQVVAREQKCFGRKGRAAYLAMTAKAASMFTNEAFKLVLGQVLPQLGVLASQLSTRSCGVATVPAPATLCRIGVVAAGVPTKTPGPVIQQRVTGQKPTINTNGTRWKAPEPAAVSNSVAINDLPGISTLRPGEAEYLSAHGITLGLRNGLLSLNRAYAPAAAGIILQVRGGR